MQFSRAGWVRLLRLAAVLSMLVAKAAHADSVPERTVGLALRDHAVLVSVGLQDLFTPAARERIEIVYDIWDERFRVRTTHGAGSDRAFEVKTIDEAFRAVTTLINFPIELGESLTPGERYAIAFRGDLNPLSPELMSEVRRWLRQPAGAQPRPGAGRGDSFFGTFVTVFVNPQIEDSERQVSFTSQTFEVPRR